VLCPDLSLPPLYIGILTALDEPSGSMQTNY
jgi:hypothetical protein